MGRPKLWIASGAVLALVIAGVATAAVTAMDFGQRTERELADHSEQLFGVEKPIEASSTADLNEAQALANPAPGDPGQGSEGSVVAAGPETTSAPNLDQMVLWPPSHPTHIIAVNEEGTGRPGSAEDRPRRPGRRRRSLTGIDDDDPVRATPWGTIIFGEEAGDGAMYEIIDPLERRRRHDRPDDRHQLEPRRSGEWTRSASTAFEGLASCRTASPTTATSWPPTAARPAARTTSSCRPLRGPGGAPITSLDQSPYAERHRSTRCGSGRAPTTARASSTASARGCRSRARAATLLRPLAVAARRRATTGPRTSPSTRTALAAGNVRFCGNNTGRDAARYCGETICITDGTVAGVGERLAPSPRCSCSCRARRRSTCRTTSPTSRAAGNWIVHEDGSTTAPAASTANNDLWTASTTERRRHRVRRLHPGRLAQRPRRGVDRRVLRPDRDSTSTSASSTTRADTAPILDITGWH